MERACSSFPRTVWLQARALCYLRALGELGSITLVRDDLRALWQVPDTGSQTTARVEQSSSPRPRRERTEVGARALGVPLLQSCSPAVTDIMGARRAWTVEMISSMSMP